MIGCGMMGQEHLRNIALMDGARVGAIFLSRMAGCGRRPHGLPPKRGSWTAWKRCWRPKMSRRWFITSPQPHAFAATGADCPDPAAPGSGGKAAFHGCCRSGPRARSGAGGAPLWVAMEYRYMPPVAALIEAADRATGGIRMLTIREHRFPFLPKVGDWNRFNAQTGGTLVEKCCHFLDLMRHILRDDPVRIMASGGQDVNHLEESYAGQTPDIWDNAYVIVDFKGGARAMLELCMFAEGARYQEEISAIGPMGKIECLVPGPGRFWPAHLGEPPVPQLIESPRNPKGPRAIEIPVDPALLAAGDHNGSTFYQHARFAAAVRGQASVEVTMEDGIWAVLMGLAAQESARTGRAMAISERGFTPI